MVAYTPQGFPIIGTLERMDGVSRAFISQNAEGKLELEWTGRTDVLWDTQKTVIENEERIFIDEKGNTVPESGIIWK